MAQTQNVHRTGQLETDKPIDEMLGDARTDERHLEEVVQKLHKNEEIFYGALENVADTGESFTVGEYARHLENNYEYELGSEPLDRYVIDSLLSVASLYTDAIENHSDPSTPVRENQYQFNP